MIFLSERLFFDGLIGNMEVSTSRGRGKKDISVKESARRRKPYMAIAKKELIMICKTPVYLLNTIGGVIIIPIIIVISTLSNNQSLEPLRNMVEEYPYYIVVGGIFTIAIMGVLNSVGSTTFSREGKNLWIQRALPIKAEDQIVGRILPSLFIQVLGTISVVGSLIFLVRIDIKSIVIIVLLGMLVSIPATQIGMIIDIVRPLLIWDNQQKAMNQNLNVLISMGLGFSYMGLLGITAIKLLDQINIIYIYLLFGIIFIISAVIFFMILMKLAKKQFAEPE